MAVELIKRKRHCKLNDSVGTRMSQPKPQLEVTKKTPKVRFEIFFGIGMLESAFLIKTMYIRNRTETVMAISQIDNLTKSESGASKAAVSRGPIMVPNVFVLEAVWRKEYFSSSSKGLSCWIGS